MNKETLPSTRRLCAICSLAAPVFVILLLSVATVLVVHRYHWDSEFYQLSPWLHESPFRSAMIGVALMIVAVWLAFRLLYPLCANSRSDDPTDKLSTLPRELIQEVKEATRLSKLTNQQLAAEFHADSANVLIHIEILNRLDPEWDDRDEGAAREEVPADVE